MAGDGGRVPDVSEQRAEHRSLTAKIADELRHNDECGTGPLTDDEYMDDAAAILRIVGSDPASVLVALLAESPEATVAAFEALLTSDEAVEGGAKKLIEHFPNIAHPGGLSPRATTVARAMLKAACRSLLSKAPKGDGDA